MECPINRSSRYCSGRNCALAGTESGQCLIKIYLEKQTQTLKDNEELRLEMLKLRNEMNND